MSNKKNVDNGHRRHKCSICGRVRNEELMEVIIVPYSSGKLHTIKTRYGNICWVCVDNPDCQHKALSYSAY